MLRVGASSFLTTGSPKNFSQRARGKREKKSENLQPAAPSSSNLLLTHVPYERRSPGSVSRSPNISRQRSSGRDTLGCHSRWRRRRWYIDMAFPPRRGGL